jgi:hypothetical protein
VAGGRRWPRLEERPLGKAEIPERYSVKKKKKKNLYLGTGSKLMSKLMKTQCGNSNFAHDTNLSSPFTVIEMPSTGLQATHGRLHRL